MRPEFRANRPTFRLPLAAALGALSLALCGGSLVGCESEPVEVIEESGPIEPGSFRRTWEVDVDRGGRFGPPDRLYVRGDSLVVYTDRKVVQRITEGGRTAFINPRVSRAIDPLYPPLLIDALGRLGQVEQALVFPKGNSYAVHTLDGQFISEAQLDRNLTASSYAADGVVYVGTADPNGGRLLKIDPTKPAGNVLERVLFEGSIQSRPVAYQNLVYAADTAGNVYGMNEDLTRAWGRDFFSTEVDREVVADLTADDYGLYVPGRDGTLYCLDRLRGRVRWKHVAGQPLFRRAIPVDDYVYQPVPDRGVVALSKTEGSENNREPLWTAEGAVDFLSHDERNVYLLHEDGHIIAHDKASGEERFRSERNDYTRFALNRDGPRIYAATADGRVVAIDPVLSRGEIGRLAAGPLGGNDRS